MAITLPLTPPLENGTCYTLTGNVSTYTSGTLTFTANDGVTTQTIGTQSSAGTFEFDFTATADHFELEYNDLFGATVKGLTLTLGEDCLLEYCSECFDLKTNQDWCFSTGMDIHPILEFTASNDENIGSFPFADVNYEINFLAPGGIRNANYEYDKLETYKYSNGTTKLLYQDRIKSEQLIIHDVPPYMHDAIAFVLGLDNVNINGVDYVIKSTDYSPDYAPESLMAPCQVEIIEKVQKNENTICNG